MILFLMALATAVAAPSTHIDLNPKLKIELKYLSQTENGFSAQGINPDQSVEVQVRGVRIENREQAKKMQSVEFANLKNLYGPRVNPYAGQVTATIACKKPFLPKVYGLQIGNQQTQALIGGANSRRQFGACTEEQISFWSAFFSYYDDSSQNVIETRVFMKAKSLSPKDIEALSAKLERVLSELYSDKKP